MNKEAIIAYVQTHPVISAAGGVVVLYLLVHFLWAIAWAIAPEF